MKTAEEIIVTVYRQLTEMREAGKPAAGILLQQECYRQLQQYRTRLGALPEGLPDYISEEALFGLPIYAASPTGPAVQVI